jgi:hypothetical protein
MRIALRENLVQAPAGERFARARDLGADGLELLVGPHGVEQHPLCRPGGSALVRSQAQAAGVAVASVFAGAVLEQAPHGKDPAARRRDGQALERLLDACAECGGSALSLPLFGMTDVAAQDPALAEVLAPLAEKARRLQVALVMHSLAPVAAAQALRGRPGSPAVQVAYDLNLASVLQHDAVAEVELVGDALGQVRVRGAGLPNRLPPSAPGAVDFVALARAAGRRQPAPWWVIDQVAGDDVTAELRRDLDFLRQLPGGSG